MLSRGPVTPDAADRDAAAQDVPTGASVAASTAGGLALYALLKARGLVLVPLYAWLLDPRGIGVVNLCAAVATLLAPVLHAGLPTGLLVQLPHVRGREEEARGYRTALAAVAVAALAALLLVPVLLRRATSASLLDARPHAWVIALFAIAMALRELAQVVPQLRRQTGYVAALSIAIEYGSAALGLALVAFAGLGAGGILWGTALVMTAGSLHGIARSLRLTGPGRGFDRPFLRSALGIGLPMLAITTAYTVVQMADRFFLAYHHGAAAVGVYSIAYTVASAVLALAATVNLVFLPVAVRLQRDHSARLHAFIGESIRFVVLAGGLSVAGALLVGAPVIRLLAGAAYDAAGAVLPLLVLGYALFTLGQLLQWIPMTVTRRAGGVLAAHLASAVLILGLDAGLIPRYGIRGAAAAAVAAYGTGAALMAVVAGRALPGLRWGRAIRPALAGACAIAAGFWLRLPPGASLPIWVAAGLGLVVAFALLALAFGALGRRDFDLLRGVVRGLAPGDAQP